MTKSSHVTVVVPSFNQGQYLDKCLESIFNQKIDVEVFVMDGGSTDNSIEIIKKWENKISYWRSHPDNGQSAAINEGMSLGTAPYCCWLNSDDFFLEDALSLLIKTLNDNPKTPVCYGKVYNLIESTQKFHPLWIQKFSEKKLAMRCIISQPGTLIRRKVWDDVGGVDDKLKMSMDYDLWWRIFKKYGDFKFVDSFVAVNRDHLDTKTNSKRFLHYQESIQIVKKYYGSVPLKWWLAQPYSVWYKYLKNSLISYAK